MLGLQDDRNDRGAAERATERAGCSTVRRQASSSGGRSCCGKRELLSRLPVVGRGSPSPRPRGPVPPSCLPGSSEDPFRPKTHLSGPLPPFRYPTGVTAPQPGGITRVSLCSP